MTEHDLQKAVVKHLEARQRPNVWYCAIPNGGHRNKVTAAKLKAEGVRAGAPDLFVLVNGRAHAVELKTEKGRLSPAQRTTAEQWEAAGGYSHVGYGLDDTLTLLAAIGAIK